MLTLRDGDSDGDAVTTMMPRHIEIERWAHAMARAVRKAFRDAEKSA